MTDDIIDISESDALRKIVSINDLVHSPVRMAVLIFLSRRPTATFPELQHVLDVTSGNLSSHIIRLEKAQLLVIEKKFIDVKPTTVVSLTSQGIQAINQYKEMLNKLLSDL